MVGVPTSNGCVTCRQRKIKCDETWPVCRQCQRSRRQCSGPRDNFKFIEYAPKAGDRSVIVQKPCGTASQPPGGLVVVADMRPPEPGAIMQIRHHHKPDDGFRSAAAPREQFAESCKPPRGVPQTGSDALSLSIIAGLQMHTFGLSLMRFGEFMKHLPARLGRNAALDSAAACLIDAHSAFLRNVDHSRWINLRLYGRALRSLQQSLGDPKQRYSSEVFCATAILQRLEFTFAPSSDTKYIVHAGGLSKLLQTGGPPGVDEDFVFLLVLENHGYFVRYALHQGVDCFLVSPEWDQLLLDAHRDNEKRWLRAKVLRQMAWWPTLMKDVAALHAGDRGVSRTKILQRAETIAQSLREVDETISAWLEDAKEVREIHSAFQDDVIPTVYEFCDYETSFVFNYHAMCGIIANRITQYLSYPCPLRRDLEKECLIYSRRIWMSHQYARNSKPFGFQHYDTALILSFEAAERQVQDWIISTLNEVEGARRAIPIWTKEAIMARCKVATGRGASTRW